MKQKLWQYRLSVFNYLIRDHGWEEITAKEYIVQYREYTKSMWESASPPAQTAQYIAMMKEKK